MEQMRQVGQRRERRLLPCSSVLPLVALTVWVVTVAIPTTMTYFQLRKVERGGHNATVTVGHFRTTITVQSFFPFAFNEAVVTRSHAITALNLPGAFVAMPVSVATTWPDEWYPNRLDLFTWRALTVPFYCLPAWWLAGVGLDGLLGRRRVGTGIAVVGTLLGAVFVVLLAGTAMGLQTPDRVGGWWVYAGLVLWIGLFAAVPLAWGRQRFSKIRK